ncbi:MAG TPA: enoyl-CoA hydratase-related protein [Hyphomonas sp.]|nr:enoyl-CoA hydratase/isomerase family protein [Hyphomonas sp.]MCB9961747.1 enoyl-CoA hydratase/isomerase family protein [Hyphomonas sp.]MCB9972758.1 enoyl-CoA hydratase/isomerase family protein [Hyphomonas sp.]MCC0017477.1 enoyl-CoA hydratase/isomerase family protein [Rhodobiaceae bacterium]HPE48368.1 enoyl-CoA hydratase-related protein [Hyphomonas sp.]
MTDKTVRLDKNGPVFTLTLNVPEKLNALSARLLGDLMEALDDCAADPDLRVLILTGAGRGFCAGADLSDPFQLPKEMSERRAAHQKRMDDTFNMVVKKLLDLPAPTIAAVNGVAAGGGYGLALACDLVVAAESAKFILVFTRQLGLIPDMGASWHPPRSLGRARAMASAFFGEPMTATEAVEQGLIWKAVPDAELQATVESTAQILARGPTRAYVETRHALDKATRQSLHEQLDMEARVQSELLVSEDFAEAVKSFMEKRPPTFRGR